MDHIILASSSPRRRELLDQIRVRYVCSPVDADETPRKEELPEQYVVRVAATKSLLGQRLEAARSEAARSEAARSEAAQSEAAQSEGTQPEDARMPVLGADTAVVLSGEIMGKPQGRDHALAMLSRLSGRRHQVLTAVSVRAQQHWQALTISTVGFRLISREEMIAYWATGEPADKAGAYSIQGLGALFVNHIEGSFSGVVGLPLYETAALLRKAGVSPLMSEFN